MLDSRATFIMPSAGLANGSSDEVIVGHLAKLTFQISEANGAAFGATVTLRGRVHESLPYEDIAAYTGPALVVLEHKLQAVQLVVTNYTTGTLAAGIAGLLNIN